jgi:hypothetical protein
MSGRHSLGVTKKEQEMPGNPREMITSAERRFPVRIRIALPPNGLGQRHTQITVWLDVNCGADGWAMTPSGRRGVLNDALSIYFADANLASPFVARWCVGRRVETAGDVFQVREDEPEPRVAGRLQYPMSAGVLATGCAPGAETQILARIVPLLHSRTTAHGAMPGDRIF